jgi:mannose-6-phosphate isomerase-like protein (cupin superfamily)
VNHEYKEYRESSGMVFRPSDQPQTQTAVMTLGPAKAVAKNTESHQKSEQVLIVLKGEVLAEVEGRTRT